MQTYELTLILSGSFDEKKIKEQLTKFEKLVKDSNGLITNHEDWGKRTMAYPIKKNLEGYYVFYNLVLEELRVNPLARLLENDDNILRHLLVKTENKKKKTENIKQKTETAEVKSKSEDKKVKVKKVVKKSKKQS